MSHDIVILGGGPGGYVAAIRLGNSGKKVVLVERDRLGGVCLNAGCIPSKALIHASGLLESIAKAAEVGIDVAAPRVDLGRMQDWKGQVVGRLTGGVGRLLESAGVLVITGEGRFLGGRRVAVRTAGGEEVLESPNVIVATGARPIKLPGLPFGERVLRAGDALELREIPEHLVIVGGGVIGVEIGTVYARLGSRVTIVELLDGILPGTDPDLVKVVARGLRRRRVDVLTTSTAEGVEEKDGRLTVHVSTPKGPRELPADRVLVAVGFRPNTDSLDLAACGLAAGKGGFLSVDAECRTEVRHIFAIGDVTGPPFLAHRASKMGLVAAGILCGEALSYDVQAMPAAIFSDPEVATVGLTERQAGDMGLAVRVGSFPLTASGRALTTRHSDGLIKVIAEAETGALLGVGIVGPSASDLIAEATLAIEMGASLEDVALTVHAHPTLPEAFLEACEVALGRPVHVPKAR